MAWKFATHIPWRSSRRSKDPAECCKALAIMIDPLIVRTVSLAFAALFLLSAWHKLTAPQQFRESVKNYRILPGFLISPVSMALPVLELLLGVAWLAAIRPDLAAYTSATLLALYALSMGVNLARGRIHIGCGCGVSTASAEQPLSISLLVRNIFLVLVALLTTVPSAPRTFGVLDYLTIAFALFATMLLYITASQLLTNRAAMTSWRDAHD